MPATAIRITTNPMPKVSRNCLLRIVGRSPGSYRSDGALQLDVRAALQIENAGDGDQDYDQSDAEGQQELLAQDRRTIAWLIQIGWRPSARRARRAADRECRRRRSGLRPIRCRRSAGIACSGS